MPRDSARPDLYARVTGAIVADLEAGVRPWTKPWSAGGRSGPVSRPLRAGGQPYSGVNVLLLWSEALAQDFTAPTWMTFRQAQALGAQVRRGEQGATVVYANRFRRVEDRDGQSVERSIPFLKAYTVFNVAQIDGLPAVYKAGPLAPSTERRIQHAEDFFATLGARIRYGGDAAYYAPGPDHIQMPAAASSRTSSTSTPPSPTRACTGPGRRAGLIATSGASAGVTKATPARSWWPSSARPSCAPT